MLEPTETKRRAENVPKLDFIFFGIGDRISANTTGDFKEICTYTATWAVYNLVIMKSLMAIVRLFYKHDTTDFCGARPRATKKTTNLRQ